MTTTVFSLRAPALSRAARTVSRRRLPDMVVNSPGAPMIHKSPMRNICKGMMEGVQCVGMLMPPDRKRIGLGWWHCSCALVGSFKKWARKFHTGLVDVELVPCVKSKSPGPSVVPPAKPSPSAPMHVVSTFPVEVNSLDTVTFSMSTYMWMKPTSPSTGTVAVSNSLSAMSAWFLPMIWVLSNSSLPGPMPLQPCDLPPHVALTWSHGEPSGQNAPRVRGETSPSFVWPKAATNGPRPVRLGPFLAFSTRREAVPLLSPLM
mmetsp:Transcript_53026/g.133334  ORF Transcript_53026/g.133334 Transcript_53026/m.133334 type:complete len:261 (+) Transcript_53026:658-1440(+)